MTDIHELALELAKQKLSQVSRLTVVDKRGRAYEYWFEENEYLSYQFQDDGRTLKIFIGKSSIFESQDNESED